MSDKFKKGDLVRFDIGYRKLSGSVVKVFHNKKMGNSYLIMTHYEIVEEKDLRPYD